MLAPAQYIGQAGCRSGFSSAGRHDQQVLPESKTDLLTYSTNRFFLVVAVCDFIVDGNGHQIQPLRPAIHQLLQIALTEYAADFALRAALIIPKVCLKTVGGKHHGAAAKFTLQAICIQHSLLATNVGVFTGALGLHDRQRQSVFPEQDIVHVSHLSNNASHPLDRVFLLHICICTSKLPTHLLHVHIDINLAGLELGKVCCHEGTIVLVLLFGCGDLRGHLLNLLTQCFYFCILFTKQTFLFFDLLCVYDHTLCRNFCFLKLAFFVIATIAIVHPLNKLKKALQGSECVASLYAALRMNGQIAKFDDKGQLAPSVIVHGKTECRLMNQCLQVIFVRHLHCVVCGVDPLHRQFQCFSAADGAHGRRGNIHLFCFDRCRSKQGVFLFLP